MNLDLHIPRSRRFIYKQVIIAGYNMVMRGKSLMLKKQGFGIGEVTTTHPYMLRLSTHMKNTAVQYNTSQTG